MMVHPGPAEEDAEMVAALLPTEGARAHVAPAPPADESTTMLDPKKSSKSPSCDPEDPISCAIGEYGRWQLLITFLLSLFNIPCTWHIFVPTFSAAARGFWCSPPAHLAGIDPQVWREFSQPEGPCTILDLDWRNVTKEMVEGTGASTGNLTECTAWTWEGEGDTIISEWSLVCKHDQLNNVAEMVFLAGVALGGLVSGVVSDRYGRKRTLMTSVVLQTVIGVTIAFSPWFTLYLVLRTLLGFISVGVVFSGFVLSLEVVGGVWRTVAGVSYLFPVSLSYVSIAGIAWLLRRWRHLQLAVSLPGAILLLFWFVLPESPRWLLALGRKKEVLAILHRASACNRRALPPGTDKRLMPPSAGPEDSNQNGSAGLLDLFRTKTMRKNTFCLFIIWFSVYLVYYGLVLNVGNIGGDLYINSVLSGVVEIPAIAISILFLVKMGRRWPLCLTLVLSGLACLGTLLVPGPSERDSRLQWLTTALAMLGKFSVSSSNAVMPVFTAELYPTVIRNLGVGASNVSAGVALMLVPYLWNLSAMHSCVPMGVLGAFGVVGGLCVLYLPETGNRPLVGTLHEPEVTETTANGKNHAISTVTENYNYTNHIDGGVV